MLHDQLMYSHTRGPAASSRGLWNSLLVPLTGPAPVEYSEMVRQFIGQFYGGFDARPVCGHLGRVEPMV